MIIIPIAAILISLVALYINRFAGLPLNEARTIAYIYDGILVLAFILLCAYLGAM